MTSILANLDCEAQWAGIQLPARVLRKISALASLLAALVDGDDVEIWAPAEVDASRLVGLRASMRVGVPGRADLTWADPDARPFNDRRFALAVAPDPDIRVVTAIDELAGATGPWVCKAPWTTAGRDRCRGDGPPAGDTRVHLSRMLARGPVMFEPWRHRLVDTGTCGRVSPAGEVVVEAPHTLVVDARGGFAGIDLAPPPVEPAERDAIVAAADAAGRALAAAGYVGPYAIDSFVYQAGDARRLRAVVEINARYSFGHVARALAARLGIRRLGFTPPPPDCVVLVAPTADDPTTAWVA